MDKIQIKDLLQKQQIGQLTDEEQAILDTWYLRLSKTETVDVDDTDMTNRLDAVWARLEVIQISPEKVYRLWPRIAAAASILLVLSAGGYLLLHKSPIPLQQQTVSVKKSVFKNDVKPGDNRAILTLGNGQQVVLTGAKNGTLAMQGNTAVTKAANGRVIYNAGDNTGISSSAIVYNTISTPAAGKWEVILPDKSHVWLDAVSSIRFPTTFNGKDRKVEITGQAYFEVAHNAAKPFRVSSRGQTVEVLGTHFNINAYSDEPVIKTTLLEGSVKIGQNTILKPGEQAINSPKGISVEQVDTDNAVGWKQDDFVFNNETFGEAMRKIARWYNVEMVYDSNVKTENILPGGWISRKNNISVILKRIESTGEVHFKIDGRRVTITE